jgi:two-component system, chemotaxis family, protein-glutamate methylesterase/glutaminase
MTTPRIDLIVIGGSAGALEPLLEIASTLSPRVTAPVAAVLHVPAKPSLLPELLANASPHRRVREPEDKEPLEPGTLYIAPPGYHMLIEHRDALASIALSVDEPVHYSRPSIDVLFESAADAYGAGVVGVLLSGSNEDGADGLARIVASGGIGLVQAAPSNPEMPAAALARLGSAAREIVPRDLSDLLIALVEQTS